MERDPREDLLLNPKPGTAAAAARDFGIDLTLTIQNLRLTPEERIRRLDDFIDGLKQIQDNLRWLKKSPANARDTIPS
jgi:hypothetical protein